MVTLGLVIFTLVNQGRSLNHEVKAGMEKRHSQKHMHHYYLNMNL